MTDEQKDALAKWYKDARIRHVVHSRLGARFCISARLLGVPTVIMTTVVATILFTALDTTSAPSTALQLITGSMTALAAVLSALQASLKNPELEASHHSAAAKWGELRNQIEALPALALQDAEIAKFISELPTKRSTLENEAPSIPNKPWDKAKAYVEQMMDGF